MFDSSYTEKKKNGKMDKHKTKQQQQQQKNNYVIEDSQHFGSDKHLFSFGQPATPLALDYLQHPHLFFFLLDKCQRAMKCSREKWSKLLTKKKIVFVLNFPLVHLCFDLCTQSQKQIDGKH